MVSIVGKEFENSSWKIKKEEKILNLSYIQGILGYECNYMLTCRTNKELIKCRFGRVIIFQQTDSSTHCASLWVPGPCGNVRWRHQPSQEPPLILCWSAHFLLKCHPVSSLVSFRVLSCPPFQHPRPPYSCHGFGLHLNIPQSDSYGWPKSCVFLEVASLTLQLICTGLHGVTVWVAGLPTLGTHVWDSGSTPNGGLSRDPCVNNQFISATALRRFLFSCAASGLQALR